MTNTASLIVEGKYLLDGITETELSIIKNKLTNILLSENYRNANINRLGISNCLKFTYDVTTHFSKEKLNIKQTLLHAFGKLDEKTRTEIQIEGELGKLRPDSPMYITITFSPAKGNSKGTDILIRSEPLILAQMRWKVRDFPTETQCEDIVLTNKQFIEDLMLGLGAIQIIEPKPIEDYHSKNELEIELKKMGFEEISDLLLKSRGEIFKGKTTEAMTKLRSAFEKFAVTLCLKEKITPEPQHKIASNLQKLKEKKFFPEQSYWIIHNLSEKIHKDLSDIDHNQIILSQVEALFRVTVTEDIMKLILDKAVLKK